VIEVGSGTEELAAAVRAREWVTSVEIDSEGAVVISASDIEAAERDIPALVAERGLALKRLEGGEVTLEEVFVDLVGEARQ